MTSFDGLTRTGTGCFIAVLTTYMATVGVKGLIPFVASIFGEDIDRRLQQRISVFNMCKM